MTLNETFEKLNDLQTVLVHKYEVETFIEEMQREIQGGGELLEKTKSEYDAKMNDFSALKTSYDSLNRELDEVIQKREKSEADMENTSTHREYELLEKQISEADEREGEIRLEIEETDKALAKMNDEVENAKNAFEEQKQIVAHSDTEGKTKLSELESERESLIKESKRLEGEIENPELYFKFERIVHRNGVGLVEVRSQVCMGCHMLLPAQFCNEVREASALHFCPYCSRVLKYEEGEMEKEIDYLDDTGSLADIDFDKFDEEDFESEEYEEAENEEEEYDEENEADDYVEEDMEEENEEEDMEDDEMDEDIDE